MNSPVAINETAATQPAARPSRSIRIWTALIVLATLAVYFWIGMSSFDGLPRFGTKGSRETDHFNLLTHGFMQGHLYLDREVKYYADTY